MGEPLRPFLHHRHADGVEDGHDLTLPDDLRDLVVVEVDFASKPYVSGRFPVVRRPLAALGAEDVRLPEVDA